MKKNTKSSKILKSVIIALIAVSVASAAGLCVLYFNGYSGMYKTNKAEKNQIKVACVGDSITYGHGVSNWEKNNYPAVLDSILGDKYCAVNFGVSGAAVQSDSDQPYVSTKRYRQSLDFNADIVIFMLGSNDSKPENWKDAKQFEKQYNDLLDSYFANGQSPLVYLCTPAAPFYTDNKNSGLMNFDISREQVNEISDIVKEIAGERGLGLIDINGFTQQHPEWFKKDGVHPDAAGAAEIAEYISEEISNKN